MTKRVIPRLRERGNIQTRRDPHASRDSQVNTTPILFAAGSANTLNRPNSTITSHTQTGCAMRLVVLLRVLTLLVLLAISA